MSVNAKAQITTRWNGVLKPIDIFRVIDFDVDSGIDTDSDQWSLTLGDQGADLVDVMKRDNEVLVTIFMSSGKWIKALNKGFADEIGYDIDNKLVFTGRDMSAVAVDSQAPPAQWRNARPAQLIAQEARLLKIGDRVHVAQMDEIPRLWRDGSESYWEFWYRVARKSGKFIWFDADGALYIDDLNYNTKIAYKFGEPKSSEKGWIPVEMAAWRKSTTGRIGESFVYGHNGKNPFMAHTKDKTIQHWIKKPNKIVTDSHLRNFREANTEALDTIHDSIVGAVEWRVIVADPGFLIETNRMASVHLPTIGLSGTFYIVGARVVGGVENGLYQEIRLREKNFAVPRAVPTDPTLDSEAGPPSQQIPSDTGQTAVNKNLDVPFIECFVKAANAQHGRWGFVLYLAVLLGIADVETGGESGNFRNVRESGSVEWYNPPNSIVNGPGTLRKWEALFANSAENPLTPTYGGRKREAGVGVMQLTDRNLKQAADKLKDPQLIDEYVGGRWNVCANIMEAAIYLRSLLVPWENSGTVEDIWEGVGAYNGGPHWKSKPTAVAYMNKVKHLVMDSGGWLDRVKAAFSEGYNAPPIGTLVYPLGVKHDGYPNFPMGGVKSHYDKPPDNWQSNNAVDMGVPVGTPVYAMRGGRVIGNMGIGASSQFGSFSHLQGHQLDPDAPDVDSGMKGLRLTIQEAANQRYYAHLHQIIVRPNQAVQIGQLLGYSGWANAAHLHIAELYPNPQDELPPGNMEEVIRTAEIATPLPKLDRA